MQITPPFAYPEIETLKKTDRVVLPKPGDTPAFCRELHVMPVSYTEIPVAQRDYPIVFVSSDNGASFMTMAILGLKAKQNLFVSPLGWDRSVYVPAYVRRYPFCMAKVTVDNTERDERVVCLLPLVVRAGTFVDRGDVSERVGDFAIFDIDVPSEIVGEEVVVMATLYDEDEASIRDEVRARVLDAIE
jgi:hypothetical protein